MTGQRREVLEHRLVDEPGAPRPPVSCLRLGEDRHVPEVGVPLRPRLRERVEVWRLDVWVAEVAHAVGALVVGEDEEDVGAGLALRDGRGERERPGENQE